MASLPTRISHPQPFLQEFETLPIDPVITEALDSYVAKRKEILGNDEPILEPSRL